MDASEEQLRYPIGGYQSPAEIGQDQRELWLADIATLPRKLRTAVSDLSEEQLDTPYRPGGWTVRQVVHHLADSHLNSYQRFRLAVTEQSPLIKPYDEAAWAELPDAKTAPVTYSLSLLDGLHARWIALLRSLDESAFARTFRHPELGEKRLDWTLGLYAWHCRHHVAHIHNLRERMSW
ncbi:MAG TPA: bacillithiol transferase BstA [Bryobacteraceae bacterium]|jgi:uncharacterized damage-inducible protein DinB|nr:bacillithiol transferase BstA [Bryobacteraceae bacterium]